MRLEGFALFYLDRYKKIHDEVILLCFDIDEKIYEKLKNTNLYIIAILFVPLNIIFILSWVLSAFFTEFIMMLYLL